jgi:hypothetical protein
MKRNITLTAVVLATFLAVGQAIRSDHVGLVPRVYAQDQNQQGCSLATLSGSYLVTGTGDVPIPAAESANPPAEFPVKTIAIWNFDGQGNMSGFGTSSSGGHIRRRLPLQATYTLDSDCTGTFTFSEGGAGWELFVTTNGNEGQLLNLNPGSIGTRSFKRR